MDSKVKDIQYPVGVYIYDASKKEVCIVTARANRGLNVTPLHKFRNNPEPKIRYLVTDFMRRYVSPMVIQRGDKAEINSVIYVVEKLMYNYDVKLLVVLKNPIGQKIHVEYDKLIKNEYLRL